LESGIDGSNALDSISCASSTSCSAVDESGNVVTYDGSGWSPASDIDGSIPIYGVSCSSTTRCTAVDAEGVALTRTFSPSTAQFTWDLASPMPDVLSDSTYDYVYGPSDAPAEQINLASSTPTYMTYSPSDSSWLTTNQAGDETGFWRYDAFGSLAFGTPTSGFGFAGQYTDATTGLSNMRARWFASQTGEFDTRDADFAETTQAYVYAEDDPVNGGDPTGNAAENRGNIQAQIGTTVMNSVTWGPYSGYEDPPTKNDGYQMIVDLLEPLSRSIRSALSGPLAKLTRFIQQCPAGGCGHPGYPQGWQGPQDRTTKKNYHVDVNIFSGVAFVSPCYSGGSGIQTASCIGSIGPGITPIPGGSPWSITISNYVYAPPCVAVDQSPVVV
jgi:RHS repeat-associated protein